MDNWNYRPEYMLRIFQWQQYKTKPFQVSSHITVELVSDISETVCLHHQGLMWEYDVPSHQSLMMETESLWNIRDRADHQEDFTVIIWSSNKNSKNSAYAYFPLNESTGTNKLINMQFRDPHMCKVGPQRARRNIFSVMYKKCI
jgi:hypothetical protein